MRILFVTARPPWPSRRGDQARTAGWIDALGPRHDISVLSLRPPGFPAAERPAGIGGRDVAISGFPPAAPLHALRLPAQVALHVSSRLRLAFASELERFRPDVVVPVLSRVGWLTEPDSGVPAVIDLVDSLGLNMENRARRQLLARPFLLWEARRVAAWDRRLVRRLAAAAVVSERDRRAIANGAPELTEKVHVIPFGIEVPEEPPEPPGGRIVLLSGNLGYFPTVDGARWFADAVWPRLRERRPDLDWWLAGARPPRAIRRLGRLPGVRVHADPPDLAELRRRAAVAVVPLRSGSGTPIKILEAMADGVPVVTTSDGCRGLDGVADGAVAVADDPEGFAEAVARLAGDRPAALSQSRLAWEWVRERHALARVVEPFERLLRTVAGAGGR